jgi:hypothetical protein
LRRSLGSVLAPTYDKDGTGDGNDVMDGGAEHTDKRTDAVRRSIFRSWHER